MPKLPRCATSRAATQQGAGRARGTSPDVRKPRGTNWHHLRTIRAPPGGRCPPSGSKEAPVVGRHLVTTGRAPAASRTQRRSVARMPVGPGGRGRDSESREESFSTHFAPSAASAGVGQRPLPGDWLRAYGGGPVRRRGLGHAATRRRPGPARPREARGGRRRATVTFLGVFWARPGSVGSRLVATQGRALRAGPPRPGCSMFYEVIIPS